MAGTTLTGVSGARLVSLKMAAVGIGVLIACMLGEVAVRLVEPKADSEMVPLPGSARLYGYPPGSRGYSGGVPFKTNSWGFRGWDISEVSKRKVLLVLGDSYAFGYGVPYESSVAALLEKKLRDRCGESWSVLNLAIPGFDTAQEIAALREFGSAIMPGTVLLLYHLNDIQRNEARGAKIVTDRRAPLAELRKRSHLLRFLLPRLAAVARRLHLPVRTTTTDEVEDYLGNTKRWKENQAEIQNLISAVENIWGPCS